MVEILHPTNSESKKEDTEISLMPHSSSIDYTNTGWEKINIGEKLPELIKSAGIDGEILNYIELSGGYFNKVIMTETASEKSVVKISPLWNKGGLARENFAYSNLKNKSGELFKLPKIYSYVSEDNKIIPDHEALIREYIEGKKPTDNELDSEKFHEKIAFSLDSIHSVPMKGYGWLNKELTGKNNSWHDFLTSIDNLDTTINSGLLQKNDIDWVINKLINECDNDFDPVLLYGDLKPENILIKNGDIYLIDFENCFSGHKYYDIGIGLSFIPQIWKHLNIYLKEAEQKKAKKQIILYAMRHAISCLGHRINIGDRNESTVATKRFFELKKLYESEES